jgi:CDP-4-dehydro-6-deoxyglucose reductase, E1
MSKKLIELQEKILELINQYAEEKFKPKTFKPGKTYIPPSGKLLGNQEIQYMVQACLDAWLTTGRFNEMFETELADFLGVNYCLSVNSGSSANLLAFSTLTSPLLGNRAIQKGDEVIGVAAGFPTTVNPIIQFGAIPVFVDVDIKTHNINTDLIEEAISEKTKAIMLAHALGNPFNLERVKELCDKYNLWLIEDTCDALGAEYNGKKVGTFGDIGTLSFYPAHHITMGEGGAVFMNSRRLKKIAESFRDWGRDCFCAPGKSDTCGCRFTQQHGGLPFGYDHKYVYSHSGYNLKITDMQAACGLAQLRKINLFIEARRKNFQYLANGLRKIGFINIAEPTENSNPSWFGLPLTIKKGSKVTRNEAISFLEANGIGTRLVFAGNLIKQPYFLKEVNFRVSGELINTDFTMTNTFWIGVQPALTREMLDYIIDKFFELERNYE